MEWTPVNLRKWDWTRVLVRDRGDVERVLAQKWQAPEPCGGRARHDEVGMLVLQGEQPCKCDDDGWFGMRGDSLGVEVVAGSDPHQLTQLSTPSESTALSVVRTCGGVCVRRNGVDRMRIHCVSFDVLPIVRCAPKVQTTSVKLSEFGVFWVRWSAF